MSDLKAKDIMSREVFTISPETRIKDFANFLLEHHVSGAPVLNANGTLAGIATETDLIFRDAAVHIPTVITLLDSYLVLETPRKHDQDLHKMLGGTVADIMSTDVTAITPETPLQEIATIMQGKKRHLLPVLENGRLVGVVGKADLVRAIAREE